MNEDRIGREPIMAGSESFGGGSVEEEGVAGVALGPVKEKWNMLGPLKLEDIIANSSEPID